MMTFKSGELCWRNIRLVVIKMKIQLSELKAKISVRFKKNFDEMGLKISACYEDSNSDSRGSMAIWWRWFSNGRMVEDSNNSMKINW